VSKRLQNFKKHGTV
jgi:DNA repair protein RadD